MSSLLKEFKLTEEDFDKPVSNYHLEKIPLTCCKKWRLLRIHLELDDLVVSDIDHDHHREEEKRVAFFSVWNGLLATHKKLIHALLKIGCRGDAEKVCKLLQESVLAQQPNSTTSVSLKSKPN